VKILVFNQDWCVAEWRAAGHDVRSVGFGSQFDVSLNQPLLHIDTILQHSLPGFEPDRIVFWDNSAPIAVLGIEETKIPTLFYSVDTHHHVEYHKFLSHVFDRTLVAQQDYLPFFQGYCDEVTWMPLWASRYVDASEQIKHDAVFVGNMNAALNPDRVKFFEDLKKIRNVYTTMGEYWTIFPHARLVINQTVKSDLNYRVFETMMCGTVLLTERSSNGLYDLFREGEHFLGYDKGNVQQAAEKIDFVLSHPAEAREIAQAGRAEILRAHLPQHRAAYVLKELEHLEKKNRPFKGYAAFVNFSVLARRMEKLDMPYSSKALLQAMRIADDARRLGEPIQTDIIYLCILSAITYDRTFKTNAGETFIAALAEAHPDEKVLQLSRIRSFLNRGDFTGATRLAEQFFQEQPTQTFRNAETVISTILTELIQ